MDRQPLLTEQPTSCSCRHQLSYCCSRDCQSHESETDVPSHDLISSAALHHHRSVSPGLQFLIMLDKLLLKRKLEIQEILSGIQIRNQYNISSSNSEVIFSATQESDVYDSSYCPSSVRPFDMRIYDTRGQAVMLFSRRISCDSCCLPYCMQRMEIASPPGSVIGYITQEWSLIHPKFRVEDPDGEIVMRIESTTSKVSRKRQLDYSVLSVDGCTPIGKIKKLRHEKGAFPSDDNYEITFPFKLEVRMKSVILGACFFIDSMNRVG